MKKIHWVGWHKVVKPKKERGLGLQAARGKNIALLSKLNCRFHVEKESLWVRVLRVKYCSNHRLCSSNANRLPYCQTWSAMKKGMETFNRGIKWVVGRNINLNFSLTPG